MGLDLSAIMDPRFNADIDKAVEQYAARVVGEMLTETLTFQSQTCTGRSWSRRHTQKQPAASRAKPLRNGPAEIWLRLN